MELGIFLRENGLHSFQLEAFKDEMLNSLNPKAFSKTDNQLNELKKKNKELENQLARTQSALAEYSARVILLKKSQEIWGDQEVEK